MNINHTSLTIIKEFFTHVDSQVYIHVPLGNLKNIDNAK